MAINEKHLETLQGIFQKVLDDDRLAITASTVRDEVDMWDSLTHVLLVKEIEQEFSVKFQLEEIVEIRSVKDILELIEEHQ